MRKCIGDSVLFIAAGDPVGLLLERIHCVPIATPVPANRIMVRSFSASPKAITSFRSIPTRSHRRLNGITPLQYRKRGSEQTTGS